MATKHLYECEDVAATLLHSLLEGNSLAAVRAAKEIYVSGESELLHRLLSLAWLLSDPNHPNQQERVRAFCAQDSKTLLFLLCGSQKQSLPPLPEKSDAMPPNPSSHADTSEWKKIPHDWTISQAAVALKAVRYALQKKYWQHAVYLTSPLIHGNILALTALLQCLGAPREITHMLETTVYTPLAYRILMHTFAFLCAVPSKSFEPEKRLLAIWNASDTTGRAGRTFAISSDAMSMWRVHYKPAARLIGAPVCIADEDATAYWHDAVAAFGITVRDGDLCFANDEHQENFYEKYFPDDIPDEWSVEERKKSHDVESIPSHENHWQVAFLLCWA